MQKKINTIINYLHDFLIRQSFFNHTSIYVIKKLLSSIGLVTDRSMTLFLYAHMIAPLLLITIISCIGLFSKFVNNNWLFLSVISTLLGCILPIITILYIRSRNRNMIDKSITMFLETTCICSELGASLDSTIKLMSECFKILGKSHLVVLLDKLHSDLYRMPSRQAAWDNFEQQINSKEASLVIKILAKSDMCGLSVLSDQRKQAKIMREIRVEKIKKSARSAKLKVTMIMTVTTVLSGFLVMFPVMIDNITSVFDKLSVSFKKNIKEDL